MHWGTPRRRGDDIIGRDVNLASRVSDLAGAGEVLVTDHLIAAAGGEAAFEGVVFDSLGSVFVKGVADAVPVSSATSRSESPLAREDAAACASAE
jgi:class 3 adenylate cyclase